MESREGMKGRDARDGIVAERTDDVASGYVMTHAPALGYAGHLGDEARVVDRSNQGVYVVFDSGIREFFPPLQFAALFRRR